MEAGPLGFAEADLLEEAQPIPHCGECAFVISLESPPPASDPKDTMIILVEMGTLAVIGFAGLKWRVRFRRKWA